MERILSMEEIRRVAPSVFALEPHESRSDRYGFIPTVQVLDALLAEGFQPFKASQTRTRDEGRRDYTKHMLRFRHPNLSMIQAGSNLVAPEIIIVNSHDGLSRYKMMAGLFSFVCENGLVVGDNLVPPVSVMHSKNVVQEVLEGAFSIIQDVPLLANSVQEMRNIDLTEEERLVMADASRMVKFVKHPAEGLEEWKQQLDEIPVKPGQVLQVRRRADYEQQNTLWGTYNIIQENLVKGGLHYNKLNEETHRVRRQSTRQVNSITEDVRLNKALWTLAEEMKKIKTGN